MNNIPKVIHYCWFGGSPLNEMALKCIESWKKFCPNYEIVEWNESNFDFKSCEYAREAYELKKWAFVSDYARFKILYEYGGVYFDTDVELIKPIDEIIDKGSFMAREDYKRNRIMVAPGLGIAVSPKHKLYKEIIDMYEKNHFEINTENKNILTVVKYVTSILKKHGLEETDEIQKVLDVYIYPHEYFCPLNYKTGELKVTDKTYAIHHYEGSWLTVENKYANEYGAKLCKHMGTTGRYIGAFIAAVKFRGISSALKDLESWVRRKVLR